MINQVNSTLGQNSQIPLIEEGHGNATSSIKRLQATLGTGADGDFGSGSVASYERWTTANNKTPVVLRDSKTARQVLTWIVESWPTKDRCLPNCPIKPGHFLALIYFESRDSSTRTNGQPYTYFNAVGGPYGYKRVRTTATGLAQFTRATASREIAYDGQRSISEAVRLMFSDANKNNCNFDPDEEQRALDRWEAWRTNNDAIIRMGDQIDALIKDVHGGDPSAVSDSELNSILGISK